MLTSECIIMCLASSVLSYFEVTFCCFRLNPATPCLIPISLHHERVHRYWGDWDGQSDLLQSCSKWTLHGCEKFVPAAVPQLFCLLLSHVRIPFCAPLGRGERGSAFHSQYYPLSRVMGGPKEHWWPIFYVTIEKFNHQKLTFAG